MKIAFTGPSGRLGSLLLTELKRKHEVVTLGRKNCDIPWSLGVIPSPREMQGVEALVHCAWSTRDRRQDFHLNVGGTLALAKFAEASNIPFLFISSVAALSDSYYGGAKREAEGLIKQHRGSILRIGLVPQSNPYLEAGKRRFGLAPLFPGSLNVTEFELLSSSVDNWLEQIRFDRLLPRLETAISSNAIAKDEFINSYRWAIPLPIWILRVFLRASSRASIKSSNALDALNSLITTPRVLPTLRDRNDPC